jgi:hypothetical protein
MNAKSLDDDSRKVDGSTAPRGLGFAKVEVTPDSLNLLPQAGALLREAAAVEQTPVFTSVGGNIVVEGLQIADVQKENSRSVTLNVGDEVVVMGAIENKRLMLRPTGVFTVAGGAVNANGMVEGFKKDGPGVPLDQFIARVLSLTAHN